MRHVHFHFHDAGGFNENEHPRAGNGEFTSGGGTSSEFKAQAQRRAKSLPLDAPDESEEEPNKSSSVKNLFRHHQVNISGGWKETTPREVTLPLNAAIHPTQHGVSPGIVNHYINKGVDPDDLPEVIELPNGHYAIVEGHHRIASQILQSQPIRALRVGERGLSSVTATSKRVRANPFAEGDTPEQAHTVVKLSNGKEFRIGKLNATESMGLPGWHDLNAEKGSFLGNTEEDAIKALIAKHKD